MILEAELPASAMRAMIKMLSPADPDVDSGTARAEPAQRRGAWALITMWLVAVATGGIEPQQGLADAEKWFFGTMVVTQRLSPQVNARILSMLCDLPLDDAFIDMLPYILDPLGEGSRRHVLRNPVAVQARRDRKEAGIFYTPGDVADFMVDSVLGEARIGDSAFAVLDPACGTGVFLRSAVRRLLQHERFSSLPLDAFGSIYGVDTSMLAIEQCAFVLLVELLTRCPPDSRLPYHLWQRTRVNLCAGDSLLLGAGGPALTRHGNADRLSRRVRALEQIQHGRHVHEGCPRDEAAIVANLDWHFPERAQGFGAVVANPPYAPLGEVSRLADPTGFESLDRASATKKTNAFIPFIELAWKQVADAGSASVVVPLSLAYNHSTPFRALREQMEQAGGAWRFTFFDRTPDSIFGDDIKQRVAIAHYRKGRPYAIETSGLVRWTSRTRVDLFTSLTWTPLGAQSIANGIPKINGSREARCFALLKRLTPRFSDACTLIQRRSPGDVETVGSSVCVAGTAYNWLSVYRDPHARTRGLSTPSQNPVTVLDFPTEEDAWLGFGVLCSRLVYWLWRVEGDGFHVPSAFLAGIPIDPAGVEDRQQFMETTKSLWMAMLEEPIVSVNGGRETITYCTWRDQKLINELDRQLCASLGLDPLFAEDLQRLVETNVLVDREDSMRTEHSRLAPSEPKQ